MNRATQILVAILIALLGLAFAGQRKTSCFLSKALTMNKLKFLWQEWRLVLLTSIYSFFSMATQSSTVHQMEWVLMVKSYGS